MSTCTSCRLRNDSVNGSPSRKYSVSWQLDPGARPIPVIPAVLLSGPQPMISPESHSRPRSYASFLLLPGGWQYSGVSALHCGGAGGPCSAAATCAAAASGVMVCTAQMSPPNQPRSSQALVPSGSLRETGDWPLYAYAGSCCGSPCSSCGSTEMNRPATGSYSRAPRWVRPVLESRVPPTKPLVVGHAGGVPRGAPNGAW